MNKNKLHFSISQNPLSNSVSLIYSRVWRLFFLIFQAATYPVEWRNEMVNVVWFLIGALAGTVTVIIIAVCAAAKEMEDDRKEHRE